MFRCEKCGEVFEDLRDLSKEIEKIEYGDKTYYETNLQCFCGGDLEEIHKCKFCSEFIEKDKEICDKCLTMEKCFEIGEEHRQCLELNGFVANMFNTSEIEEILMRELKEAQELGGINKYDLEDYLESI